MQLEWPPIRSARERALWQEQLAPLGQELADESEAVGERASLAMRRGAPEVFEDDRTAEEVQAATAANVAQFSALVVAGEDPRGMTLPTPTVKVAHATVQRHLGLAPLLRVYSLGHEQVWRWLFERASARIVDGPELARAADLLSEWLFAYVNESTKRITEIYEEERKHWLTSALAEQVAAVDAILAGEERDEERASRRLRHDVRRQHLGLGAWVLKDPDDRDAQSLLHQTVRDLAAVLEVETTLVLPDGPHAVQAWLSRRKPFGQDAMASLAAWTPSPGVRLSSGSAGAGLAGFRRSQIEAGHARRLAHRIGARGPSTVQYDDVAVAAMSSVDPEQARRFVHRVLGPLAADDEGMARIAETLEVYLDEHGSRSRAAARLFVHANTVAYRIRQAEDALERSFSRNTLDLRVALALLPVVRRDLA